MTAVHTPRQFVNPEIPPLVAGDRLTRDEFERRYWSMPHVKKAELIEGVVDMPAPVSLEGHGSPHLDLVTWLGVYRSRTPGVQGGDNTTVHLDSHSEPQPDAFLRILPECGGQSRTANDYVEGAPELVAEIAASSASYDLHDKLSAYCRSGVKEYIVWRTWDRAIDWFVLRGERYQPAGIEENGWHKSEVFSGLWLDPAALLRGEVGEVLAVLQKGLDSPEHAQFVRHLAARRLQ
jgi:Uma2 family endonuclease